MKNESKTVTEYIESLENWQAEICVVLRELIREAAPEAAEVIKWSQPVYEVNGPFCYFRAYKDHVNLGFFQGAELPDPQGLLEGTGKGMRHVKVRGPEAIRKEPLQALVRLAAHLCRGEALV